MSQSRSEVHSDSLFCGDRKSFADASKDHQHASALRVPKRQSWLLKHHVQCLLLAGAFPEMEIPNAFRGRGFVRSHGWLGSIREKPRPMRVMPSYVPETS